MTLIDQAAIRARRQRLWNPPGGRVSSELEIVTEPSVLRAQAFQRAEAERVAREEAAQQEREERLECAILQFPRNPQSKQDQEVEPVIVVRQPKIKDIVETVCEFYGQTILDVISERRTGNVIRPRQVICYLARTMTARSFPQIGQTLGGRDHTTVLHAYTKIKALLDTDTELAAEIEFIRGLLGETRTKD